MLSEFFLNELLVEVALILLWKNPSETSDDRSTVEVVASRFERAPY